jgi:hypothetical protein
VKREKATERKRDKKQQGRETKEEGEIKTLL